MSCLQFLKRGSRCVDGYLVANGFGRGTTYRLDVKPDLNTSGSNLNSNLNTSGSNLNSNLNTSGSNLNTSSGKTLETPDVKSIKMKCGREELFDMIKDCADEWKSVDTISREVKRSIQYLKGVIIPQMVKEGLLKRKYDTPHHPAQQYKRTEQ